LLLCFAELFSRQIDRDRTPEGMKASCHREAPTEGFPKVPDWTLRQTRLEDNFVEPLDALD
jgi:hypothetical protein